MLSRATMHTVRLANLIMVVFMTVMLLREGKDYEISRYKILSFL